MIEPTVPRAYKRYKQVTYAYVILGYFDLNDLHQMDEKGASYISRLKLNTRIYLRNPNPEYFKNGKLKKQTEYIPLDMEEIMH